MGTKLNVGPSLGGLGVGAVALSSTITIEETGTVYDRVIEVLHSACAPRQLFLANGWNDIAVPTGLGQAPAGVLIVPPATNYAITVQRRAHDAVEPTVYDRLHKNAPFLWYFDLASVPAYIDLYWGGQNYSGRSVTAVAASDWFLDEGHSLVAGEVVLFTGGTPPVGFTLGTPYYVVNPVTGGGAPPDDTFQLAATPGGSPIAFADAGASITYSTDNGFLLQWL